MPGGHQSSSSERSDVAGGIVAQVAHVAAGEQQAAQHRPVRARRDRNARGGGDHLGGDVGLLGGEPALLDGVRRHVADRVDAVDPDRRA